MSNTKLQINSCMYNFSFFSKVRFLATSIYKFRCHSFVCFVWLNEIVGFHPSFSRHGITRASSVLLIWLNENVHINLSIILIPPTGYKKSYNRVKSKVNVALQPIQYIIQTLYFILARSLVDIVFKVNRKISRVCVVSL